MQTQIDVIANNMANVNTTGFKKSRAEFPDLLYQEVRAPSAAGFVKLLGRDKARSHADLDARWPPRVVASAMSSKR